MPNIQNATTNIQVRKVLNARKSEETRPKKFNGTFEFVEINCSYLHLFIMDKEITIVSRESTSKPFMKAKKISNVSLVKNHFFELIL